MVVDHGPIKYLISKIRYDDQESPKPNSNFLESYLRQHEENKPRLYLRRIQGLESLHSITDSGLNPIFKDDFKDFKDGVYIYDSIEEIPEKKDEDDFEIRSFVDSDDLETIRKYRNTNFIINGEQIGPRIIQKEKLSPCQRRNKRLQAEVQDMDVTNAADEEIELESEVVDESLEDIAMKRYGEMEQQVGRKLKVDTWKGKGVKRICLCNTKKYKVVKGKFGNKSVKIKLTVNRNTRNAAESKQKKKICLCNLAKKIIKTTAELTVVQNKDALSKTLNEVLDTLNLSDDMVPNEKDNVTVSSTKLVDPIDVEEIESVSEKKICVCKKRKKNVSLKIVRKTCEATVMVDAQTEIPDSMDEELNKLIENGNEYDEEDLKLSAEEDAINKHDEADEEKLERGNEVPDHFEDEIQSSVDGSQELQIVENEAKEASQDKLDRKKSRKKKKRVCLCNRKIKNVAIRITKTRASRWSVQTENSADLKEGQNVEATELDRSPVEAAAKEIKSDDDLSKPKSMRKKRICLCERQLEDVSIKIIKTTSDSSFKKHIHVVKRHRTNNLKNLKYRMKIEQRKLDGEADLEISKLKWRKKKKKLCFCDFHLESIDEEIHTKEQIPEPIETIDSIEKQQGGDTLESKEEIQFKEQVPGPIEKMDNIKKKPEVDTLEFKTNESSLYEIYNPHERIEDQSESNLLSTQTTLSSLQEILKPPRGYVDGTEEQSESNVLFVKASENDKIEEQMQEAINKNHDLTKVAEKSNITDAISQTSISVRTVKGHSLQRILSSSSKAKKNDHSETNGSTMVKTGPTKNKTSCLCKDQHPKKILITRNNLSKIEFDKISMQLKSQNKADVENTRKLKQKKKVCFCEDLLMKEILEDQDNQSSSSDELEANRSCQETVSPRNTKKTTDKYRDAEKGGEIVIRKRYVAESSYGKDQDMQELVDEMLEGTDNRLTKPHEFKEAGEMTNKLRKLPNVKCIKKQCKAIIKENRSIENEKLEIDASNEDAINDTRMKKKKKKKKNTETCRCDCNCPETASCNRSSLIELIDASELLSACNKEEFEMPDTRKCNNSVYKVLYASDLKPIIEESNEDEDKLHERNQNRNIKKYKCTTDDIREDQRKETSTSIRNCYKDTICNRLSPIILFDPIEQSTLSIASRLSEEMTLDQRTQTKERHYTKKHLNTSNNKALKRKSKSSLVRLLDSDDDLSLNTDHVSDSANVELKSIIDELNQDLWNTKGSKKASKCNQMDSFYEDQGDGITVEQLHRKKPSLISPDSHLDTSKDKMKKVCDGSYSIEDCGNGKMNEIKQQVLKTPDARDGGCVIEESKELNQKSQNQDFKFATKQLIKGVSSHKISKQMETFCVDSHDCEKDKNFSKHSLSRFSEPCSHSKSDTDPVSKTSSIKELKSAVSHSKKGILDEEVSRKPKKKSSILNTITKCIADAERHIKKPFKRICSYTEHPVNKKASPIKPLNLDKHSKSREVKEMNKLYVNSEKKSNREECISLDNKRSGQNAQAKEISLGKDQSSTEVTNSSATGDQQMQCSNKCKFEEGTVSNETSSTASDNNNKVSDIKSDTKSNLARETSHTGTQTKKSTVSTNHSIKDLTNGDISDQKENSIFNRSPLAYSNEPSGSLTFTTEPGSNMSDFTQQKSDTDLSISAKGSSSSSKRTKHINPITENTDNKNQPKNLDNSCCSLIEDNDLTNTPLGRSKQIRNVHTAKPSELISEEYKSLHGRTSDQQTQTTNRTLKAKQKGTEMINGGLEVEKEQICHKPSLIISLYPNKYSVHCTNKVSETSDITVIKSKATGRSFSDQGTQSEESNPIARFLTADLVSDKLFSCNEESNKLNSNLTGEDSMLATELMCCREYVHGSRGEEESYSSENKKQRSLVREKCTAPILEESQLTKLRSTSYSCSEYPICKDSSLIVLLSPDKNSAYNIENMKKKHGTTMIKSVIKESSTEIIDCEASDRVRKICRCRETKLCDKSSMTTPHGHSIDRIKKEKNTWDQDTQAKGTNVISTQFTTSFIDGSAKNTMQSNYSSQNSESSLIISLGLETNSLNGMEDVKKASKTTTIKQTRRKVQKDSLSNKLSNQSAQTKGRYHIAKQSNKDDRIVHGKMITLPGSLGPDENTNLRNGYSNTGGLGNSAEKPVGGIMDKDICHVNRETKMRHTSVIQGTTNNEVLENNSTLEELEELFMYEEEMQWKSIAAKEANMSGKNKLKKLRSTSCSCSEYPISKGRSLIVLYSPDRNSTYDIKHMRNKHDKRKMKSVAIGSSTEISNGEVPNEKFNYGSKCGETNACDRSLMTILYDVSEIAKHITEKVRHTCDLIVANAFANNEGTKSKQSEVTSPQLTTYSIDGSGKSTKARRNHYRSQKGEIHNEPSLLVSLDPRNMEEVDKVSKTTMTKHTRRKVRRSRLKKEVSSQNTQTKENKNDEIIHGKKQSAPGSLDSNEIKTDYCNTEGFKTSSEESSEGITDKTKIRHLDVTPNEGSTNSKTLEKKNCAICLDMIYKNESLGTDKSSMIEMKNTCKHTDFKERKSTASQSGEDTLMGIILGKNSKAKEVSYIKEKSDKATKYSKSKLETCSSAGDANYSIPSVTELLNLMQVRSKSSKDSLTKSDSTDVVPVIAGDIKGMETTSEEVAQKVGEANEKSMTEAKHEKISFVSPDGKISVIGNWKGNVAIECLNKRKPTF